MFQQGIVSAYEIECDLAERNRSNEATDSYTWFQTTASLGPNWVERATRHLGHTLIKIGQQLENYSLNTAPAMNK
jgi:hypothetical protein